MGYWLLCLFGFILLTSTLWAYDYFGLSCFEQLIFHIKVPLEGTNTQFIFDWFKICFMKSCLFTFVLFLICQIKEINIYMDIICIGSFCICLLYSGYRIGLYGFIMNLFRKSDLYEKYYVDGKNIKITFPEKKRNLILLYVESLETTFTSKENGGNYDEDLIEEISSIAKVNLNFSHNDMLGGAHVVAGTGWTTGGLVGQSSGIPLLVPLQMKRFKEGKDFFKGIYTLGDILEKEGYNQEFLIGSKAEFGGRKFYYDAHGHFHIFDLDEAYKQHKIPSDYHEFWGYEDEKLFQFAKDELLRLSKLDQPFHLTMLTVDSHHPYGYKDHTYVEKYPQRLSNIIRGNSKKIGEFMDWLKQQDFYDDTTIIITGDHTSMAAQYIHDTYDKQYDRTIFNTWINAQATTTHQKNRLFSSFDMYPTILHALGVEIEGNRLGLGVDLFSGEKTIPEEIGWKKFDEELRKQSDFYKKHLL